VDAFGIREKLIAGYRSFTEGFVDIQDPRIRDAVVELGDKGRQWPDPWLSLNPSFSSGGRIDELVRRGLLHPDCDAIFRPKKDAGDRGSAPITRCTSPVRTTALRTLASTQPWAQPTCRPLGNNYTRSRR